MDNNFRLPDFKEVARALKESGGTAAQKLPSRTAVRNILADIQCLMFPDYFHLEENEGKSSRVLTQKTTFDIIKTRQFAHPVASIIT